MALITINGVSLDPILHAQALKVAGLESVDASASNSGQSHLLAMNPQELFRCPLPLDK